MYLQETQYFCISNVIGFCPISWWPPCKLFMLQVLIVNFLNIWYHFDICDLFACLIFNCPRAWCWFSSLGQFCVHLVLLPPDCICASMRIFCIYLIVCPTIFLHLTTKLAISVAFLCWVEKRPFQLTLVYALRFTAPTEFAKQLVFLKFFL